MRAHLARMRFAAKCEIEVETHTSTVVLGGSDGIPNRDYGVPAVEVHLSDVSTREDWRRTSVIADLCIGTVSGKGIDGYRDGLKLLADELEKRG